MESCKVVERVADDGEVGELGGGADDMCGAGGGSVGCAFDFETSV